MAEEKKFLKREPSRNTSIKQLTEGKNLPPRVAVAGTIVNKNAELYSFLIDDGEGTILVITNNVEGFDAVKEGQFVRVLGKTWGEGEELEIQADVIQDLSGVDSNSYKRVMIS